MKINYRKASDSRHPRQLFVLVNEFNFAAFPVRPRYMSLSRAGQSRNPDRVIRPSRKGASPC